MRVLVGEFENAFEEVHQEALALLAKSDFVFLGPDAQPTGETIPELIVRSAAKVEQCFGGITTRLWDDPYEWTLPENFHCKTDVADYLAEVKSKRINGFKLLTSDLDLSKKIPAPELVTIFAVLLRALNDSVRQLAITTHKTKNSG